MLPNSYIIIISCSNLTLQPQLWGYNQFLIDGTKVLNTLLLSCAVGNKVVRSYMPV